MSVSPLTFGGDATVGKVLVATGNITAAQLNTVTATNSLQLIPAPGTNLYVKPLSISMSMVAATSAVGATNAGNFVLGWGPLTATPTTVLAGGAALTASTLCSPVGGTALPDTFFKTVAGDNTSKVTNFSVLNVTNAGPLAGSALPERNQPFALGATNTTSACANITLLWNIAYQVLPCNSL